MSAFPNGVPGNALIVHPAHQADRRAHGARSRRGPSPSTIEQMWKLLGFNGPAVQVQDDQGRPIAIGLEDLLAGLEKHWHEQPDDLNRGRIYAQELLKYSRLAARRAGARRRSSPRAAPGDDWLALGVAQLSQEKLDKAEGTLKGAQNLMKDNPYPSLHLAKLFQRKKDEAARSASPSRRRSRSTPAASTRGPTSSST